MKFRTRLSLTSLESRENPSVPVVPPYSTAGAPATSTATTSTVGSGQTTSTGNVTVTTTNSGMLGNNNVTGQPLLESTLSN